MFGSPSSVLGRVLSSDYGEQFRKTLKKNIFFKISLPKSERVKRVPFSGYGDFRQLGSKFQSAYTHIG